jgi:hypothetical protein
VIGEVSLGGVYVPAVLLLGAAALVATALLSRLLAMTGFYRFISSRPAVDIALFLLLLGALVVATAPGDLAS